MRRLNFLTGIEFTFCAAAPVPNEGQYNKILNDALSPARHALKRRRATPEGIEVEGCLEITFPPFNTWGEIERTYKKLCSSLFPLGLATPEQIPRHWWRAHSSIEARREYFLVAAR